VAGKPVVEWAIEGCRSVAQTVVLVVPDDAAGLGSFGADVVVSGGDSRSASVRNGLAAVPEDVEIVVVHDAARPMARADLFERVISALVDGDAGGAICAVPVADTLKRVEPALAPPSVDAADHDAVSRWSEVRATVAREDLVSVQTPQAFVASTLRQAHAAGGDATDDAALVEALGTTVRVVMGDPRNLKLTTPLDLAYAEHVLGQ